MYHKNITFKVYQWFSYLKKFLLLKKFSPKILKKSQYVYYTLNDTFREFGKGVMGQFFSKTQSTKKTQCFFFQKLRVPKKHSFFFQKLRVWIFFSKDLSTKERHYPFPNSWNVSIMHLWLDLSISTSEKVELWTFIQAFK